MMSNYVIDVYENFWSWHVHGSHSVYLLKTEACMHTNLGWQECAMKGNRLTCMETKNLI
jgi:hypothetical protein